MSEALQDLLDEFERVVAPREFDAEGQMAPLSRSQLLAEADLARRIVSAFAGHEERYLDEVDHGEPAIFDWHDWIDGLPHDLVQGGVVDEGLALWKALEPVRDPDYLGTFEWEILLGKAGRGDEAIERVEARLAELEKDGKAPGDLLEEAGTALRRLGRPGRAEELLRRAVAQSDRWELWEREGLIEELAELLEEQGRGDEAERLRDTQRELEAKALADDLSGDWEGVGPDVDPGDDDDDQGGEPGRT